MKLMQALFFLCALFCLHIHVAQATPAHTLRGLVITPNGTAVPEFTVTIKPSGNKPQLIPRKHFKNGEFTLEGLNHDAYRIEVSAPLFVTKRFDFDFKAEDNGMDHSIVILHTYRNERRFIPGIFHTVSVKSLQQKIPDAARQAYLRAVEFHREGRLDDALVEYGTALRNYPTYLEALADLSTIFILYNRPESALTFLRRAQNIDDCHPIVNLNMAIALNEQGDAGGAMKLLKKVRQTSPEMGLGQYYMGRIEYSQRKYAQAEESVREAVRMQPSLLEGWLLLVKLSLNQKKYDQAREALTYIRGSMDDGMTARFIDEQLSMLPL